jgi:nicotinic acid mononucleotide adenylyltransferase/nicotinamide mononucleotide (NMN) deamidase PncC
MKNQIYIICSGGGSAAISDILTQGGASEYFIGAEIPYSPPLFVKCVGGELWDGKHVSERTAHQLAAAAYDKCIKGGAGMSRAVGIGVTASLRKIENERPGRVNQVYIAVKYNQEVASTYHIVFKEVHRKWQERDCATVIKRIIAQEVENDTILNVEPRVYNIQNDEPTHYHKDKVFIFSGSFNPMHDGHSSIIKHIAHDYGILPIIEIGGVHHHKPGITAYEYVTRKDQIKSMYPDIAVRYSTQPLFIQKQDYYKELYPNKQIVFIMGADVYEHVLPDERDILNMLVFKRKGKELHPHKNAVIVECKVDDLSSTQIRKQQRNEI